jgi:aspartate carbamoyltransferase catalytic subunit
MNINLAKRDVITIEDLSNQEIEAVFTLADEMAEGLREQSEVCKGMIMGSLFFEPSTRTRLSFEAAMQRLGGRVIGFSDVRTSSVSKGESIADTARIVNAYADIIVIRHPWEGAAKVVADYATVPKIPIINAGDGGHEHPTQTLVDLYTLKKEKGTIRDLNVVLWGDLKYGRTVHSLAYGLARFGANVFCRSIEGLEMPEHVIRKMKSEYGCELVKLGEQDIKSLGGEVDAFYIAPPPRQLPLLPTFDMQISTQIEIKGLAKKYDALYVTRVQKERLPKANGNGADSVKYPIINEEYLRSSKLKDALVMHPLPRVDELAYDVDADPRSMYFKQAARGIPIRMALTALLVGAKEVDISFSEAAPRGLKLNYPIYKRDTGVRCQNTKNCISEQPSESHYIKPEFQIVSNQPLTLRCVYCEHEIQPAYIATSKWHEGTLENKKYHTADMLMRGQIRIKLENLIIFNSETVAQAHGFKPGRIASEKVGQ